MRELSIDQLKSRIRSTVMLVLVAVVCISAWWVVSDRAGAIRAAKLVAAARSQALPGKSDAALALPDRDEVLARWERKALVVSAVVCALCLVILALTRLLLIHLDRLKLARHTVSDQQLELRFKAAQIDAALDVILQIDLEGRLVHFNQALCRMTGYRPEELAGLRLHDIEPPEFADQVLENLKLIKERQQATFESAYLGKDGKVVPVEVHARFMECEGRQLVLSIARDVTRRKQAESRERSRRMLLERIATGAPVDELLVEIIRFVEEEIPGALCSVLLADETAPGSGTGPLRASPTPTTRRWTASPSPGGSAPAAPPPSCASAWWSRRSTDTRIGRDSTPPGAPGSRPAGPSRCSRPRGNCSVPSPFTCASPVRPRRGSSS
jgi:PAS domain S-box-containing protein